MPNNLKALRQKRALSQQALADLLGTSRGQVDQLESGARRLALGWIERIAKVFNCDEGDLVTSKINNIYLVSDNPHPINQQLFEECEEAIFNICVEVASDYDEKLFYQAVIELYNDTIEARRPQPSVDITKYLAKSLFK